MLFSPNVHSDPLTAIGECAAWFALYLFTGLLPAFGIVYVTYFLLTLPMRRNERARLILDLLDLGLKEGRTPERAIIEASATRDPAPGARFHLLATHLEKGIKLSQGLALVPRLLPPQLVAMLQTGERIGDIAKVLPACRQFLKDGISQVRGALNYLLILAFTITPFTLFVPIMLNAVVLPKFREVFAGMAGGAPPPAFTSFIFGHSHLLMSIQIALFSSIWILMLAYVGGPRLRGWVARLLPGVPDRILYRLPWKRKRLQRDFSAMLAVLLDSEVPEVEALALAAESTANDVVRRRAALACSRLKDGVKLPVAIRCLDDSGELQWRLANALQCGGGFLRALTGWHEALDAKAFQLEQAAAQMTTSALVLVNGAIVAGVAIAVFAVLIQLINIAVLW